MHARLAVLLLLLPAVLGAQSVRGAITDTARAGAPVSGSTVSLLDVDGRAVAATLSSDRGAYFLRAPAAGTYRVRVDRVGYRGVTSPALELRAGMITEHPFALVVHDMVLPPVRTVAEAQCVVRPADGEAAAQLWEEARKALQAVTIGRQVGATEMRARFFERELDVGMRVKSAREWTQTTTTSTPFAARDPALLARDGYIMPDGTGFVYYAPDADVLISSEFAAGHCFRAVRGTRDRAGLVGLRFEPVSGARRSDVIGELWLDPATWELRELEYRYTNVPHGAASASVGGRVGFGRLADGRWYVNAWQIRMPLVEQVLARGGSGGPRVAGFVENGADIISVADERRMLTGGHGRVVGIVHDSLRGRPAAGVRVFLSGTSYSATTTSDGAFAIDSVPAGFYTVTAMVPTADSLLLAHPSTGVPVARDVDASVLLATPAMATLTAQLCADAAVGREGMTDLATVVGRVTLPLDIASDSVRVVATWRQPGPGNVRADEVLTLTRESPVDARGRYAVCRVRAFRDVTLTLVIGRGTRARVVVSLEPDHVRRVDLVARP